MIPAMSIRRLIALMLMLTAVAAPAAAQGWNTPTDAQRCPSKWGATDERGAANGFMFAGASIGQDGFGFAMGRAGHQKVPQIGRVIIQDDVEIGANTTIDRGALRDTVIGEGTKIDNLVQIGHNVVVGRHCIIVAQTGISGSAELGDFVALGGQVGVVGHVKIGTGAQIAGSSNVRGDVPPGVRWGGTPAKPTRLWFRELTILRQLAERKDMKFDDKDSGD